MVKVEVKKVVKDIEGGWGWEREKWGVGVATERERENSKSKLFDKDCSLRLVRT